MPKVIAQRSFLLKVEDGVRTELVAGYGYDVSPSEFKENWMHGLVLIENQDDPDKDPEWKAAKAKEAADAAAEGKKK